ncbi:UDP-glucosyltransferase 2-like isoform X1 [Leptidea sinapis]|uniref:UDP-glucosyltransferase 2-like isoform X1 n=2 Tax=Leptidea sinapis TaxID=189913 RepID=UPI0021C452B2|nr:UDP-glucosyltransferase 2-like isoform X1 [Leptidea sinapis]
MCKLLIIILYYSIITLTSASRILAVFPTPCISHQVTFRPLIHELVRRGHQVTFITPDPAFDKGKAPSNLTEIDVHDISYDIWRNNIVKTTEFGRKDLIIEQIENILYQLVRLTAEQVKKKEVQNIINNKDTKYDLLLLEACAITALVYSHVFKIPVIQVSSFGMMIGNDEIVGSPTHPLLYPTIIHQRLYNLSIWEKLDELYKHIKMMRINANAEIVGHKTFQNIIGSDLPSFNVLKNNVDMLFLNIHPIWIDNQPLPPNVISIWGIYKKTPKELPQELKSYLDSSKQGVIYISLGSNALSSDLPPEIIQMFIRVFSQLPYNVLWKWEKDELPGRPQNVKISKWFPQSDLLNHPKIKLFITQGGLQSTEEAINAGVPLIGIPMLGDQWYNVEKYARHGIGIKLDMDRLNEEQFKAAIDKVLIDKSYKENIIRLRTLFHDQPENALDRAIWWTEYVLRHNGAKHLRSPAANMSWMQYYEIQLILIVLILVLLCSVVLVISVHVLWKYVLRNSMENIKIKTG